MKNYSLLLLLLLSTNLFSQINPKWRSNFFISNPTVITTDIQYDGINTYFAVQNYNSQASAYLLKLDSSGNLLKSDTIDYMYSQCDQRLLRANDGSLYMCGQRDSLLLPSKIKIVKTDSMLNVQWTKVLFDSSADSYNSIRIGYSSFDHSIFVVGFRSITTGFYTVVVKLDSAGNILWVNDTLPSLGLNCIRFRIDHRGGIVLGGFIYNPGTDEDFHVAALDSAGNNLWHVTINEILDDRVQDMTMDEEDNIYAYGFFSTGSRSRIIKILHSGNTDWVTGLNSINGEKISVNDSGVYVAGVDSVFGSKLSLAKLDTAGNIILSTPYSYEATGIISLTQGKDAYPYVCYNNDSAGQYHWAVSKFNPSLNMQWTYLFNDSIPSLCYPTSFYLMENKFIISGLISNQVSAILFEETIPLSVKNYDDKKLNYLIDQNGKKIIFSSDDESLQGSHVEVYDVNSRLIIKRNAYPYNNNYAVDFSDLHNGFYVFVIRTDKISFSVRVVIF